MIENRIDDGMVSVLMLSAADGEFKPRSGKTKDYKIGICCFSSNHTELGRKSKDWIICPSGATCPSAGCCFSELAL